MNPDFHGSMPREIGGAQPGHVEGGVDKRMNELLARLDPKDMDELMQLAEDPVARQTLKGLLASMVKADSKLILQTKEQTFVPMGLDDFGLGELRTQDFVSNAQGLKKLASGVKASIAQDRPLVIANQGRMCVLHSDGNAPQTSHPESANYIPPQQLKQMQAAVAQDEGVLPEEVTVITLTHTQFSAVGEGTMTLEQLMDKHASQQTLLQGERSPEDQAKAREGLVRMVASGQDTQKELLESTKSQDDGAKRSSDRRKQEGANKADKKRSQRLQEKQQAALNADAKAVQQLNEQQSRERRLENGWRQ
jgi:hypothetical protein